MCFMLLKNLRYIKYNSKWVNFKNTLTKLYTNYISKLNKLNIKLSRTNQITSTHNNNEKSVFESHQTNTQFRATTASLYEWWILLPIQKCALLTGASKQHTRPVCMATIMFDDVLRVCSVLAVYFTCGWRVFDKKLTVFQSMTWGGKGAWS